MGSRYLDGGVGGLVGNTSRNQPKGNHSIYDYMQLVVACD